MNINLLKQLCSTHSVTGDTSLITRFLTDYLDGQNIKWTQNSYGTLLLGNETSPKKAFAAHIDEVGFQVCKLEEDGKARILPVGWVFANRLDHTTAYLSVNGKNIPGVILHQDILKQDNITEFNHLYLDLGADSLEQLKKLGVRVGQCGSFAREFIETDSSIIAAGLDNKISVFALLTLINQKPQFLKDNLIIFTTDEEMEDHSANGAAFRYHPELTVVLDYCPIHQKPENGDVLGESGKGPLVMYRGGNYIIHPQVRHYFDHLIKTPFQPGFISSKTLPSLEPANFENNGTTKAVNVCVPAFGYHGAAYSLRKKDFADYLTIVEEIFNTEFQTQK